MSISPPPHPPPPGPKMENNNNNKNNLLLYDYLSNKSIANTFHNHIHNNNNRNNKNNTNTNMSPTSSSLSSQDSINVLEYCPNYELYDCRARKESKERISSHLQERQKLIKKCVESAIEDIDRLGLEYGPNHRHIIYSDSNTILENALLQLKQQIDKWDGVQIKQCKKEDDKGQKILIDTWQKFAKKAKNHQDQTSWKISGDYFFAPYIRKVKGYIDRYCNNIININESIKLEINKLAGISFAMQLLNGKIKFHRTKLKPLIRHRTLVKSNGIHIELENLYPKLTVRKFIQNAKQKRKKNDGKSNIIAGDFYNKLIEYIEDQYEIQKKLVYNLVNDNKLEQLAISLISQHTNTNISLISMSLLGNNNNNNNNNTLQLPTIPPNISSMIPPIPSIPTIPTISSITSIPNIPIIPNMFTDFNMKNININTNTNTNININKKRKRNINLGENDNDNVNNLKKKMKYISVKPEIDNKTENENDNESDKNDYKMNITIEYKTDFEYILSSCNGECGNGLGKFIAYIIENDNYNNNLSQQDKLDIISYKFGEYGNKMRDYFISLINDSGYNECIQCNDLCSNLQNENLYISHILSKDSNWINIFTKTFKLLLINNRRNILQKLVNKSCIRGDLELLEEIEQNKILKNINFYKLHSKINKVKMSENYKMMKLQGKGLTNNEIIAIYVFIENESIVNEWIKYGNTCKWKNLYNCLISAVNKIYKMFIYKNNKNNNNLPKQLYHGIIKTNKNHIQNKNDMWIFHNINILHKNSDNALKNIMKSNNGCLLKLVNIQNDLYNGQLIVAPIDWIISQNNNKGINILENKKWISLPTIIKNGKCQHQCLDKSSQNVLNIAKQLLAFHNDDIKQSDSMCQ